MTVRQELLEAMDIVIAGYEAVMYSCPWPDRNTINTLKEEQRERKLDLGIEDQDDDFQPFEKWIEDHVEDHGGLLHKIDWYRVSL